MFQAGAVTECAAALLSFRYPCFTGKAEQNITTLRSNNKTTEHAVTNQSENCDETNKYADKNRLLGYQFLLVGVCKQSKYRFTATR